MLRGLIYDDICNKYGLNKKWMSDPSFRDREDIEFQEGVNREEKKGMWRLSSTSEKSLSS